MSFTYDIDNIATDLIAQVRLATGLTVDDGAMDDEVIQYLLDNNSQSVSKTAVDVLKNLVREAAQQVDKTTGQTSEAHSKRYQQLKDLLHDALLIDGISAPVCIHFGGLDSEEFEARNNDSTVYQGAVTEDRGVNPSVSNNGVEVGCIGDSLNIFTS